MGRQIHLFNVKTFDAADMSTSLDGDIINIQQANGYAIQIVWANGSSPVGEVDVQASNDGVTFVSILPSVFAISGNSGASLLNVEDAKYGFIKVVYTRTSGSGDLTVHVNAQGV